MFKKQRGRSARISSRSHQTSSAISSDTLARRHKPDYFLVVLALLLSVIGLIVVYSISPALAASENVSESYFVSKQAISIGLGLVAFAIFSYLPLRYLKSSRKLLVILSFIAIMVVFLFGDEINGAKRWVQIGGLSFQVAELIKFTIIVWASVFFVDRIARGEIDNSKKTLRPLLIVLLIIGLFVAKLESDLGSTGVMVAILASMAFVAGLPMKKVGLVVLIVIIGTGLAIATSSYRRDRVSTFLNPTQDCQDAGYQACQALIAVGSGGIVGKGLGNSVQAYGYLPEAQNDSIFAIYAEKFGFLGAVVVVGLYVALFGRLKRITERTSDPFNRLFVVGVLAWLATQTMINIGAMIGLFPLKGITLPFISYGGTSILFVMAALGVVSQISRYTAFEPIRNRGTTNDDRTMRERVRRPYYATSGRR